MGKRRKSKTSEASKLKASAKRKALKEDQHLEGHEGVDKDARRGTERSSCSKKQKLETNQTEYEPLAEKYVPPFTASQRVPSRRSKLSLNKNEKCAPNDHSKDNVQDEKTSTDNCGDMDDERPDKNDEIMRTSTKQEENVDGSSSDIEAIKEILLAVCLSVTKKEIEQEKEPISVQESSMEDLENCSTLITTEQQVNVSEGMMLVLDNRDKTSVASKPDNIEKRVLPVEPVKEITVNENATLSSIVKQSIHKQENEKVKLAVKWHEKVKLAVESEVDLGPVNPGDAEDGDRVKMGSGESQRICVNVTDQEDVDDTDSGPVNPENTEDGDGGRTGSGRSQRIYVDQEDVDNADATVKLNSQVDWQESSQSQSKSHNEIVSIEHEPDSNNNQQSGNTSDLPVDYNKNYTNEKSEEQPKMLIGNDKEVRAENDDQEVPQKINTRGSPTQIPKTVNQEEQEKGLCSSQKNPAPICSDESICKVQIGTDIVAVASVSNDDEKSFAKEFEELEELLPVDDMGLFDDVIDDKPASVVTEIPEGDRTMKFLSNELSAINGMVKNYQRTVEEMRKHYKISGKY